MGTTLLEALDFSWNHRDDWHYQIKNRNTPIVTKIIKKLSDYIVYAFALILGVNNEEKLAKRRISLENTNLYNNYVIEKENVNYHEESIILIINGDGHIPVSTENFIRLEEQSKCKIKFVKIESLKDIELKFESLKKNNNKIKALWIRAHGTRTSINFNHSARIDISHPTQFADLTFQNHYNSDCNKQDKIMQLLLQKQLEKLEQDSPIILESCYTGQMLENDNSQNVAQFIANTTNLSVYAPSREALAIDDGITYDLEHGFKIKIKSIQSSTYFSKGSCLARMCAIWHAFRNHEEEITRKFNNNSSFQV